MSDDLSVIEAAAQGATGLGQLPWYTSPCNNPNCWCCCVSTVPADHPEVDDLKHGVIASGGIAKDDAAFICAANPVVVLGLIAEIRQLRADLALARNGSDR